MPSSSITLNGSTGIVNASWTTATRPSSPVAGQTGYNTTIGANETYTGSTWSISDLPAAGTAGNVLTSNGTTWTSAAAAAFDAGTRLGFQQTSAPTGWTKDTTAGLNDSVMRIVTGAASSGGSTAFSTWAAASSTSAYTLTTSDIPSHSHTLPLWGGNANTGSYNWNLALSTSGGQAMFSNQGVAGASSAINSTGGGGSHSHGLSQNIKYYDFIIASKN